MDKTYTFEVWKNNKFFAKTDLELNEENLNIMICSFEESFPPSEGYEILVHVTHIEKTNMMTGKKYLERYDTPISCSPASETYWSM